MSHQEFFGRVRPLRRAGVAGALTALLAASVLQAATAGAALPIVADCRSDAGGANDVPGETDLTRSCVVAGDAPYDLDTTASVDLARLEGAAAIHVCALYNTDADAFANLAECATVKGATGNNGNQLVLDSVALYTCTDEKADRCTGATLISPPYNTRCTVTQEKADPFPGPSPGPGTQYPEDSLIHCDLATADFGSAGLGAMPLDTCSYSTESPDSPPSDCIAFRVCNSAADCDDDSPCTKDSCDASHVCRYVPKPGTACSDSLFCDGDETCTAFGFCGSAATARDCDDDVECTLDSCDEIHDECVNDPRNSVCSDDLYCTGVEVCDVVHGCQPGTPPNCSDGVACTVDTCDEESDGCDHVAGDDACDAVLAELAGQAR